MQLHEAGVGPQEAGGTAGSSPPFPPTQVTVPLLLLLGGLPLRLGWQVEGGSLGLPRPRGLSPSACVPCRVWGWPRLWRPC